MLILGLLASAFLAGRPLDQHAEVAGSGDPPAGGWLSVRGNRIVDAEGRTVVLRGFNVDGLLDHNGPEGRPAPLDDSDASLIQEAGFNVVRVPIAWSLLEPRRHQLDTAYLDRIQAAVKMLESHDLRVVLDMHFGIGWGPLSETPAWASVPLAPDIRWFPVQPWKYSLTPQVGASELYFWTSRDWQADLAWVWQAVASRFKGDAGLFAYDLYNEPHPLPLPPGMFENRFLWPFYAWMIGQVSRADPDHVFIVESTLFEDLPTPVEPLHARNVVYSPHIYTGSLIPLPFQTTDVSVLSDELRSRAREAAVLQAPVWIGELGIDHDLPDAGRWTGSALSAMGRWGIGWAWWQWREDGGWGVRKAAGQLDQQVLDRLAQPYLAAAPAGVTAAAAPGGGVLKLAVAADHAPPPAVVGWPYLTLGQPRVEGSCVESVAPDAGGSSLQLQLAAGRSCEVTIAP